MTRPDNRGRRPNERLRHQRRLQGWTLDDVAERLHRLVASSGSPELGVDAHMVGRWERGVRRPTPRYVALLCRLFELSAGELGLVDEAAPPLETKEDDVRRRQFLQHLSVVTGATMLDWDRVGALLLGQLGQPGQPVLDDLEAMTRTYVGQMETVAPAILLPALRGHLAVLNGSLRAPQPESVRHRLLSLTGETAILAGRLSWLQENRGEARWCWALARQLGSEAGDDSLVAAALVMQRALHSTIPNRGRYGRTDMALALLDAAAERLGPTASPHLRMLVLSSRAEEHAAAGRAEAAYRDLDEADRLLGSAGGGGQFFVRWDAARLLGYRGSVALALEQPEEASATLETALAGTSESLPGQRCAVVTDLAAAYAQQREVEYSCALLAESVDTAVRAGLAELVERAVGARRHLARWPDSPAVKRLDERLAAAV